MDELGKSFPVAEGIVDAELAGAKQHNENCLNCGTKLLDTFCHHCGQKDIPKRQTLGELFSNFISSFWSYEGKFFLTTKYLLTRPGFLAREYNAGKRESYYHPARMYVFISFIFFLLFVSLPDSDQDKESKAMTNDELQELKEGLNMAGLDSLVKDSSFKDVKSVVIDSSSHKLASGKSISGRKKKKANFSLTGPAYMSLREYDSAQQALPEAKRDRWIVRKLNIRSIELNNRYKDDDGENSFSNDFGQAFKDNFSKVLFYLLPVFALLLKLLFIRRDVYYSEHLVFSIYYYNFFYIAGSLYMIVNIIPGVDWLTYFVALWIIAYLLWAMKRMYDQSWRKTILKYGLLLFSFLFCVGIGISINALVIIMW